MADKEQLAVMRWPPRIVPMIDSRMLVVAGISQVQVLFRHALLLHIGCYEYRSKARFPLFGRFVDCHDAGRTCSIEDQAPSFEEQIQLGFAFRGEGLERSAKDMIFVREGPCFRKRSPTLSILH